MFKDSATKHLTHLKVICNFSSFVLRFKLGRLGPAVSLLVKKQKTQAIEKTETNAWGKFSQM